MTRANSTRTNPTEAARRFWFPRGGVAGAEFAEPTGTLIVTFDVVGAQSASLVVSAGDLPELMERITRDVTTWGHANLVRIVAGNFFQARRRTDHAFFELNCLWALWAALYHPERGEELRSQVAAMLRRNGVAHLRWHHAFNTGLSVALSESSGDLDHLAKAPKGIFKVIRSQPEVDDPDTDLIEVS